MQHRPGSFSWSEDFDEGLNYWFWPRRAGVIADGALVEEARQVISQDAFATYRRLALESRRQEYLLEWHRWKRDQVVAASEESRATSARVSRAHYRAMAAVGLPSFRVHWVMAPFGERWLFPSDIAALGVESATAEQRRQAVLDAARALRDGP